MKIRICLDAGHYGKYNRSPVVPEYYESDMVWKLHLMQKELLEGYGFEVITTRQNQETDRDLTSRGRASAGCALFISDHSNACGTESVDYPLAIALLDDKKIQIDDESRAIATKLAACMGQIMGTKQPGRVTTQQSANDRDKNGILDDEYYGVLHGAKMAGTPGIILEHSFHTNTAATRWLLKEENLRRLAEAECRIIADHFGMKKQEESKEDAENHQMSRAEFIEFVGQIAREDWLNRRIMLPSVVVAQAIKESGAGKSELAQNANALFGIKRNGWTGEVYVKVATEQLPDGSYVKQEGTEWRKYISWRQSILDHNDYIATRRIGNETEPHWKAVVGESDYKKAVAALQGAVPPYATSLTYAESLIRDYIEKENLTRFDQDSVATSQQPEKPENTGAEVLYRVQVGAYKDKTMAEGKMRNLQNDGFAALVLFEDNLWKVQAGLYRVKANADAQLQRIQAAGHQAFIKVLGAAVQKREIQKGDTVTVLRNVTYEGKTFKAWYDKYEVLSVAGDRAVIGIGSTITCAISTENIALA